MRYCKNCHVLYSSQAAACPKCGVAVPKSQGDGDNAEPDKAAVRRDWIWILIGVPVLIGVIYLLIMILNSIG